MGQGGAPGKHPPPGQQARACAEALAGSQRCYPSTRRLLCPLSKGSPRPWAGQSLADACRKLAPFRCQCRCLLISQVRAVQWCPEPQLGSPSLTGLCFLCLPTFQLHQDCVLGKSPTRSSFPQHFRPGLSSDCCWAGLLAGC